MPALFLMLAAASGAAALLYEIVWFQMMELVIGSTAISVGILLAVYMGGLGGGSLVFPRFARRATNPLRLYAFIELAIGLLGVAALFAMPGAFQKSMLLSTAPKPYWRSSTPWETRSTPCPMSPPAILLDAAEAAFRGRRLLALTTDGELVSFAEARTRPLAVAAANWVASALAVAELHADALMIDVGSTTVDLIPIAAGRVAAVGRTDLDRLLAGELVYTGGLRTNLAAIAPSVPVRDRWCPVASELFAISADVHLVLGHLTPDGYTCATPDGRPATIDCARERIARLVCADVEQLAAEEIDAIAAHLYTEQLRQIETAARRVSERVGGAAPVVPLGGGAFLARAAAQRLERAVVELPWSAAERDAAPAAALAALLAERGA